MIVKVQIYRNDGNLIVENLHPISCPGKYGWAMPHPDVSIIEGDFRYSGYTLQLYGRENEPCATSS